MRRHFVGDAWGVLPMKCATLLKPIIAASLAVAGSACFAQAFDAVQLYGAPAGSGEGRVGAAVIAGYRYLGSDERRTAFFPAIDYRWANGWFAGTTNGIGYKFDSEPGMQYGVRLTADFGRSESRSAALAGLGDIRARPEIGGFFNLHLSREFFLTSSLRYGAGNDRKGLLVDLGAGYALQWAPQWRTTFGVAATLANREYMQGHFGISEAQAQTSGYAPYQAGSGVRDLRANASLNWFITPEWALTGVLSLGALQGDAKRSPIVRQAHPVSGVVALSYRF
jgi:MipA family protein